MPNVSLSHVTLALSMVGLLLFLVLLVFVVLDLIWTLGNEVIGASIIVSFSCSESFSSLPYSLASLAPYDTSS